MYSSIKEIYLDFQQRINRNAREDNLDVDYFRFVSLFNRHQNREFHRIVNNKNDEDYRLIQSFIVSLQKLDLLKKSEYYDEYSLPSDFFQNVNAVAKAKKSSCSSEIELFEEKPENVSLLINDYYSKPSFEFRESFYHFSNNNILIYKDDFSIDSVFLTYYRCPKNIDMEGYIKEDGTNSEDILPEFNAKIIDMILDSMASDFNLSIDNYNSAQLHKQNTQSKL